MLGKIAIYLRSMQLFYHSCHHLCKGSLFLQDHKAFSDFYSALEASYDDVAERAVNKEGDQAVELLAQLQDIYAILKLKPISAAKENKDLFVMGLECEKHLCEMIDAHCKMEGVSEGIKQLLGDIADKSESRQYLISRRIK